MVLRALAERYRRAELILSFKKVYDLVPRDKLWAKLQARGVDDFFLNAVQAQYAEVPLCVKTPEGLSVPFLCTAWLKQGEPISPDLFGFYIDDLPSEIESVGDGGDFPTLASLRVPPLLHADDLAIVATTIEGFQMQLDKLSAYSARWGLQISLVKTKVLQLSSAGADTTQRPDAMVNGTVLPWVDCFTYLGVPFHETKEMDSLIH